MTRHELTLLKSVIQKVAHHNPHAWWELKRQIFDYGYQSYYPAQSFFDLPAKNAMNSLSPAVRSELFQCWTSALPQRTAYDESKLLEVYARLIVEKVVERASVGAYRTVDW